MRCSQFLNGLRVVPLIFSVDSASRLLKKYVQGRIRNRNSKRQILVEFELPPDSLFGAAVFLPILAEELNANCVAYQMAPKTLLWKAKRRIYFNLSSTRKLIGKRFVYFSSSTETNHPPEWRFQITSKEEVLSYCYRNIRIGDLVYDWYLAKYHEPTITIDDYRLKLLLRQFESYVDQFLDYIKENDVAAICVSHSVYHFAIPARIGIKFNIPVYQISLESIFFLDTKNQIAYANEKYFPMEFQEISPEVSGPGLARAKDRLTQRVTGEPGVDMPYMTTSAFARTSATHSVETGDSKIKVLIAAHDFYDSPHIFGDYFYPDFLEWIQALIKISYNCNYEWYVKTHPFLRGNGREILHNLVSDVKNFTLLPQSISHPEIVELGITHALTVYGSIAHEYPILGIPVINASRNNPHSGYSFSVTPKSRGEYERIISSLENFEHHIDEREIFEYYYMKYIRPGKSWLIANYELYTSETGFPQDQVSRKVFTFLLSNNRLFPAADIEERTIDFLRKRNYMLMQPS